MDVLEAVLAYCWESALRRRPVGADDDFFAMGGHSLAAMRIAHRVEEIFDLELGYLQVLESGTVAELARRVRASAPAASELEPAARAYLLERGVVLN